jgi:processing peptidase subunit alpha
MSLQRGVRSFFARGLAARSALPSLRNNYTTLASNLEFDAPTSWEPTLQTLDKIETSTLPSGLTVTTLSTQLPFAAVSLHVKAGPRYETSKTRGVSHFLKNLAFTRTMSRSPLLVIRDMEVTASTFEASVTRENLVYAGQLMTSNLDLYLGQLRDVLEPLAWEYILRDLSPQVQAEAHGAEANPSTVLVEALHRQAYRNSGLGNSVFCPSYAADAVTREAVVSYHNERFHFTKMTLVGFGVEHDRMIKYAAQAFIKREKLEGEEGEEGEEEGEGGEGEGGEGEGEGEGEAAKEASSEPDHLLVNKPDVPSVYTGGEFRLPGPGNARLALAFEGVRLGDPDVFATRTLSALLGGAVRYSRDGPGSGLRSRLARNVLAKNDFVLATSSLNVSYSDAGLFGVFVEAQPGHAGDAAKLLAAELNSLGSASLDATELNRAKNQAKATFLREVETRSGLVDYLARHVQAGATALTPAKFASCIDAVTQEDLARVTRRILSSPLTLISLGDIHDVPAKEELRPKLK